MPPMAPVAPREVAGRQFDLVPGYNLAQQPRAYEPIGFPELRAFAQVFDLLRLVIETRKDEMTRLHWAIKPKDNKLKRKNATVDGSMQARIDALTDFFRKPDGVNRWSAWLRPLLEDLYVIDAPTIYCQRTRAGQLVGLHYMDGATIKRVIDDWGRTPLPPAPAYQQVLKGMPAVDYTTRDLIYRPRNQRTHKVYGFSPVEQIIMTVNIGLRREYWQLSYFTEGNIPEALIGTPDSWTPQQIKDFQNHWDLTFTGNLAARRHAKFVPGGMAKTYHEVKSPEMLSKFDEWIARIICFCFGISPQPFITQVNRATAETAQQIAEETGLQPSKLYIKETFDEIIELDFNSPDLEFTWVEEEEIDQEKQAIILTTYAKAGGITINEMRDDLGKDPYDDPAADKPMVLTASGYVPIDANTLEGKQAAQELLGPPALPGAPGGDPGGDPGKPKPGAPKPATKPAVEKLAKRRRARRLAPIPFERAAGRKAQRSVKKAFADVFAELAPKVAKAAAAALGKVAKASDLDRAEEIAAEIDLSSIEEIADAIGDALGDLSKDTSTRALAQVGVDSESELVNQVSNRAVAAAKERAAELVTGIDENTRSMLADIIADGLAENIGLDEIAANIEEAGAFSEDRADLIARTEVSRANSDAALDAYTAARDEAGVNVQKEWLLGANPCPICEENNEAGAIDLDDEFPSGDDAPPAHPNCECALSPVVDSGSEDQGADLERLAKLNDDPVRDDHGRFASLGASAKATAEWLKGASAKEALSAVASSHTTKEAISFAIQSLLSHATGLDQSTWKLNEDLVEHTVTHFANITQITGLQAKATMMAAVNGLISMRQSQIKGRVQRAATADDLEKAQDQVLHILLLIRDALAAYQPKAS